LEQKFYFRSRDWKAILTWDQMSYWQITSALFSPLWAALTFFTHSMRQITHLRAHS
jgi:hypothetical protein